MQREVHLQITDAYNHRFPELSFGIGTIQACTYFVKSDPFKLYIDSHIIAEMFHGILMAIQDLDQFRGEWKLDLAQEGEIFQGVSGKMIRCKEDEIVLRDGEGLVCSLFQGPDFRTREETSSKNIVVYVFTAPGIQEEHVSNGLQLAIEILEKFGNGKESWRKVFRPSF